MSNTVIVRVQRPTLTPEERAKRMAQIKTAAEKLIIATIHRRKATNK